MCIPQSCLTLCDPMDCSLLGSSAHRILQARILEWVAISFSEEGRDCTSNSSLCGTHKAPVRVSSPLLGSEKGTSRV